ncbi:MAG: transporter [Gemmatimonadota bacterium]|nr:transporter [Gemmatimonadota bacterium]
MAAARNEDHEEMLSGPPPAAEPGDLGFGRVVAQNVRGRFLNRDGSATSRKYGLGAQRAERFYLSALSARWPAFLLWLVGGMLLLNGFFALAYLSLGPSALHGVESMGLDDPFLQAFSFSVGLFTTNGSGEIHAVGATAHWLVVLESLFGPLTLVAASGLIIARLTRPRMNIRFSESAIIAPYEGGRALMFRMVNAQPGELGDVEARVVLARFEESDGVRERDFHVLTLERNSVEMFNLHWTVVHPITADSPLAGVTPEMLAASEAEFIVFVSAHEETFSTHVTTRTSFFWDEIRWDVKWASVFASASDGVLAIDVDRLDRTERLEVGATATPAVGEYSAKA